MAKELIDRLSDGLQCGSQWRGDFKQSLYHSNHCSSLPFNPNHQTLSNYVKRKNRKSQGEKKKTTENITQSLLAQSWNFFFHPYVSRGVFSVLLQSVREKSHENLAPSKSTPQLHAPKSSETFYTRSIELQLHFREYIAKVGNIIMYQKALLQTWMCII